MEINFSWEGIIKFVLHGMIRKITCRKWQFWNSNILLFNNVSALQWCGWVPQRSLYSSDEQLQQYSWIWTLQHYVGPKHRQRNKVCQVVITANNILSLCCYHVNNKCYTHTCLCIFSPMFCIFKKKIGDENSVKSNRNGTNKCYQTTLSTTSLSLELWDGCWLSENWDTFVIFVAMKGDIHSGGSWWWFISWFEERMVPNPRVHTTETNLKFFHHIHQRWMNVHHIQLNKFLTKWELSQGPLFCVLFLCFYQYLENKVPLMGNLRFFRTHPLPPKGFIKNISK